MKKQVLALALALLTAGPALAAPPHFDKAYRPQDNFFKYVNGDWLKHTHIPPDRSSYGTFTLLTDRANEDVRTLLVRDSRDPGKDADARMVGDFYASLDNTRGLDAAGLKPVDTLLARISKLHDLAQVATLMGVLGDVGVDVPVGVGVEPDEGNPEINAVYWGQGGLGLPDRSDYLDPGPHARTLRHAYRTYLLTLDRLAGVKNPVQAAARTYAFERKLAQIQWTRTQQRNTLASYNPTPRKEWVRYAPFPWTAFAAASGMPANLGCVINEPSYFSAFAKLAASTPMSTWRDYLRVRLLDANAVNLAKGFRAAEFHFRGAHVEGLKAMPPRWRMAVEQTGDALGELVGKQYVASFFPPSSKAQMLALVRNLLAVYKEHLATLSWMTPSTRKAALAKLAKLHVKIGYPDHWRSYAGLVVRRDDGVGNLLRANRFTTEWYMAQAGKPVDHGLWGMTPQTVNAYYDPVNNEIVFPAAILQPPFFDPRRDAAYNYGAIGAVIGHEISHGYDDEGRHYDADGRLKDWWTAADAKAFKARAARLVAQFSGYEPLPGLHINGRLTLGENIADLTGVTMSLYAYHRSLDGHPAPVVDGLTGDQRFFVSFARVWRGKMRPEWERTLLMTDPHSPNKYRTNGVVTNLTAFYRAFDVKPGDKLYKPRADRVRIW